MSHDEAVTAVDGLLDLSLTRGSHHGPVLMADFAVARTPWGSAVTAYYDARRLACVAVNALRGPQVTLNGLRLVGRMPSELEDAFDEYTSHLRS